MKQKDIMLVGVIAFIGAILSFFVSGLIFGSAANHDAEVPVVTAISSDLPKPDKKHFNDKSTDPIKLIIIDDNSNTDPFGPGAQ